MMAFLYFHIDSQTGIHKREKSSHWIPPLSTNIKELHFVKHEFLVMFWWHAILNQDICMLLLNLLPSIPIYKRKV